MKNTNSVIYVLWGFVLAMGLVLLTGAVQPSGEQVGRYRLSALTRSSFTELYVIDTTTGVVKYLGKNEGKPFDQVSGK